MTVLGHGGRAGSIRGCVFRRGADGRRFSGAECLNLERRHLGSVQVNLGRAIRRKRGPEGCIGDGGRFDWGVDWTQRNLQEEDSAISSSLETQPAKRRVGQGSGSE